jgi:hypothetical protein
LLLRGGEGVAAGVRRRRRGRGGGRLRVSGEGAVHFGLAVDEEVSVRDDLLARLEAGEDFDERVAAAARLDDSAFISAATLIHINDGLRAGLEKGGFWNC